MLHTAHSPDGLVSGERSEPGRRRHKVPERRTIWECLLEVLIWLRVSDRPIYTLVLVAYAAAVMSGFTLSSLGIVTLRQDPAHPLGLEFGTPRSIRSDEFNVVTPIALSILASGDLPTLSSLGAPANIFNRYPDGFFQSVVFFDSTILRLGGLVPHEMLFAARWWLPVLLVLLFLPKWVHQVGGTKRLGWLAAGLTVVAPATAWWSMAPLQCVAYVVAGTSLMISAHRSLQRHRFVIAGLQMLAAGILIASLPAFYIPWAFVLGTPFLVSSVLIVLAGKEGRSLKLIAVGGTTAVAMIFAAGIFWEGAEGLKSMLGTVYPGSRRSGPEAQPLGQVFGAPMLTPLQWSDPIGTNASELSSAFAVTFVWAAVVFASHRIARDFRGKVVLAVFAFWGMLWLAWCLVSLGPAGTTIPVLNYVPASRASQVVGYLGVIVLVLTLAGIRKVSMRAGILAAITCSMVTAYSGSMLKGAELPALSTGGILIASGAVGLVVLAVSMYGNRTWALLFALVLAAIPASRVNPAEFGLGDLRASETAEYLFEQGATARENGNRWASNVPTMDVVMLANGVPLLSGLQRSGPNVKEWERLDPDHRFEDAWNRGGGYIPFEWTPGEPVSITTNGFDVTFVRIDPCDLAALMPEVSHIVSSRLLSASCLQIQKTAQWNGAETHIYQVNR